MQCCGQSVLELELEPELGTGHSSKPSQGGVPRVVMLLPPIWLCQHPAQSAGRKQYGHSGHLRATRQPAGGSFPGVISEMMKLAGVTDQGAYVEGTIFVVFAQRPAIGALGPKDYIQCFS